MHDRLATTADRYNPIPNHLPRATVAKSYADLQEQIAKLTAEAERLRASEVAGVVARMREDIAAYGIKPQDLFGRAVAVRQTRAPRGSSSTGEAKYSDGAGNVWGGRGPRPRWLRDAITSGHELAEFLVGHAAEPAPAPAAAKKSRKKS